MYGGMTGYCNVLPPQRGECQKGDVSWLDCGDYVIGWAVGKLPVKSVVAVGSVYAGPGQSISLPAVADSL
jgi:hypothetical protein